MTSVATILNHALLDAGVIGSGQTAAAEDSSTALGLLNQMLAQWQDDGFAVYTLKDVSFSATGATSYTIGTGGNVNRARIDNIEGAFWRSNGADYPLTVIQSFNDYQLITQKSLTGDPCAVHYQPTYPLGKLYVYPAPTTGEIHITVPEEFTEYTSGDDLSLPKKYELAVRYSLAELLKISYPEAVARMDIVAMAARARKILKRSNLRIPILKQPAELLQPRFNIATGE